MTDRIDHRAAAEGELLNAIELAHDADLSKADRAYQCVNFALIHALLAIHDTLTAADRYAANEERQREAATSADEPETPEEAKWLSLDEDDPLDEDDHRDRMDCDGDLWGRNLGGCWHTRILRTCRIPNCEWTLAHLDEHYGPLAFAPEPPQEATGDDQSASEGESGPVERPTTDNAQNAILCPECGHDIDSHTYDYDRAINLCNECPNRCPTPRPSQIARALIEQAGGRRG